MIKRRLMNSRKIHFMGQTITLPNDKTGRTDVKTYMIKSGLLIVID